MITVVVGKEIEKIKGDFESYLNGLNMVGEISYSQYSELYDEGTKQIQRAYELGKSELEKENAELKKKNLDTQDAVTMQMYTNKANKEIADRQLTKAKEIIRSLYFIIQGRIDYKGNIPLEDEMYRANQFLNSEVEKWQNQSRLRI